MLMYIGYIRGHWGTDRGSRSRQRAETRDIYFLKYSQKLKLYSSHPQAQHISPFLFYSFPVCWLVRSFVRWGGLSAPLTPITPAQSTFNSEDMYSVCVYPWQGKVGEWPNTHIHILSPSLLQSGLLHRHPRCPNPILGHSSEVSMADLDVVILYRIVGKI